MSSKWQNTFIWLDLSFRSMVELWVLKNAAQRTSQRLKWTSGARVMICLLSSRQAGKQTSRQADKQTSRQWKSTISKIRMKIPMNTKLVFQWDTDWGQGLQHTDHATGSMGALLSCIQVLYSIVWLLNFCVSNDSVLTIICLVFDLR